MASTRQNPFNRSGLTTVTTRREVVREVEREKPEISFLDWSVRVPEPKSGPLDFDRFPFQREFYEETGNLREVIVKKATQIGISAYLVRETMYWADVKGWTVIYIFPKQNLMHDFADARVRPLILGSPYLKARVPHAHTQNKGLRQIGSGFVFYRGSESVEALESVDADCLALDEYDSLVAANVPVVERRITGSMHGLIRRVGVPSVPSFGLDTLYDDSDQRRWYVKCGACKRQQSVFFFEGGHPDGELSAFVDQELVRVVCGKCRKPIDVAVGEWVAAYPDRAVRGYHASRLIVPAVARNDNDALQGIVNASLSTVPFEVQGFHNRDLGEAYAPKEGRLSLDAIKAAQRTDMFQLPSYVGDRLVTAGIDVASVRALNVRVSKHTGIGHKQALFIGQVANFDDLAEVMNRYSVQMFAIDHLPEGRLARSFCQRFPGRGYLVRLVGSQVVKVLSIDEDAGTATVRRTEALDAMMTGIREQRNLLPADLPPDYVRHMQAPVRFYEEDDTGKVVVGYRSSGPDDYAFAEVFDMVATEVWLYRQNLEQMQAGEIIALDDRMEFQRAHLNAPEEAFEQGYRAGPNTGYSMGFQGQSEYGDADESGFDSPYDAWSE